MFIPWLPLTASTFSSSPHLTGSVLRSDRSRSSLPETAEMSLFCHLGRPSPAASTLLSITSSLCPHGLHSLHLECLPHILMQIKVHLISLEEELLKKKIDIAGVGKRKVPVGGRRGAALEAPGSRLLPKNVPLQRRP